MSEDAQVLESKVDFNELLAGAGREM